MATTSACNLLQHWDARQGAGIISCPSYSLKQLLYYTLCICQHRVFQVFFDIYLIFIIAFMTAACLLHATALHVIDTLLALHRIIYIFKKKTSDILVVHDCIFSITTIFRSTSFKLNAMLVY